jgi:hypothetical protein
VTAGMVGWRGSGGGRSTRQRSLRDSGGGGSARQRGLEGQRGCVGEDRGPRIGDFFPYP